jgi:hypothetical protein
VEQRRPSRAAPWIVAALVLCLIFGIAIDRLATRHSTEEMTYTGRISAICGSAQRLAEGQDCFAVTLDPTAPPDDCYPGKGDLSLPGLGPGFWSSHAPFPEETAPGIGDEVRVTVLATTDVGCTPVNIAIVSRALA